MKKDFLNAGIEAVILGCTELLLLLNDENCVLKCLDSVAIHINELLREQQNSITITGKRGEFI